MFRHFKLRRFQRLSRLRLGGTSPPTPLPQREIEEFDVVVVGGGVAGLSTAIRLKQLASASSSSPIELRIAVVEKASEMGGHVLSGACVDPRALQELFPNWRTKMEPIPTWTAVESEAMLWLRGPGKKKFPAVPMPWVPPLLSHHGCYVGSLGAFTKWLSDRAEELGVELYPGFAAADVVLRESSSAGSSSRWCKEEQKEVLEGVQLHDVGLDKSGKETWRYEPGMIFKAKQTVFAEGCRGSCTKLLEKRFRLRPNTYTASSLRELRPKHHQTYGLGVKEVWEVPAAQHRPGHIVHTIGWPLSKSEGHDNTYGGGFLYHYGENLVACGLVVGLDYRNPHTSPFREFQKWKTHEAIRSVLDGGQPLRYGARTISEGGFAALPKLHFPGGVLVGDCAGFLNLPRIQGTHTAMKSGMLAAEAIFEQVFSRPTAPEAARGVECTSYQKKFEASWLQKELKMFRNVRQVFQRNFYLGMAYTAVTATITRGMEPFTLAHDTPDHQTLRGTEQNPPPIPYPKPDGVLVFDVPTSLSRSGVNHTEGQPCHLRLKDPAVAERVNLGLYGGPEAHLCPAGVYEYVEVEEPRSDPETGETTTVKKKKLEIHSQNCLHCKACDIKDPTQNIDWTVPEGGGGPEYHYQM